MYAKRIEQVAEYVSKLKLNGKLLRHYRGRTILVTGGAGAIGSNLIIALSSLVGDKGRVIVLDNLSAIKIKEPWNITPLPTIMFIRGDTRDAIHLRPVSS